MTFTQTTPRAVTIVGPGKVGRSLQHAALAAGIEVKLLGRPEVASGEIARGGPVDEGQLLLLAVPDTEIVAACEAICEAGPPSCPVGHLSGATGLAALDAAASAGLPTFSMHPLQSFAGGQTEVAGIPCAITASDQKTASVATALAERLGMRPFALADGDRALYHAAASIASNFLVCLEQEAALLLEAIGIEDGRRLLAPLVSQTLANWNERGGAALTGPIARGDEATVERHLEALREHAPQLVPAYRAMAERTRALAGGESAGSLRERRSMETVEA